MQTKLRKVLSIMLAVIMLMGTFSIAFTAFAATKKVTSIKLNKTSATLYLKNTLTLKATVSPSNASNKNVTWSTSNKSVATVSSKGVVTPKKTGTVTITAKAKDGSGKKATCKITVKQHVTKISLSKTSLSLKTGSASTLKATVSPSNASSKKVTWSSSDKKVATVNSKGKVTAVKAGTATITCKAADGSGKKATCKVTVTPAVVPAGAKEYKGHTYYVFTGKVTWTKAKELCENRGGHLVTITSNGENNFVASLVEKTGLTYCWLGATDSSKEGTWEWVTGEKFKYTSWSSNEPNNQNGTEHYLGTWRSQYLWNDFENNPSYDVNGYVCEWDMTKKEANSPRLNATSKTIYYKESATLKVLNYIGTVKWSSSNTKIATVDSKGKVTAVNSGTATITAKAGNKTFKCDITVIDKNQKATVTFKITGGGYFITKISTATATFKVSQYNSSKITANIVDTSGTVVYKKTFSNVKKNTQYSFTWDGKNTKGNYVSAGSYRLMIQAGTKKTYSAYLAVKTTNDFAGGNGSKSNPFLVSTTAQLKKIVKYPNAYYKQTANLKYNYESVGNFFSEDLPFNGVYDGNNKTISGITASYPLFNTIGENGQVKNLKMSSCNINASGGEGALLTKNNYGTISNCTISGIVSGSRYGNIYIGMIANDNFGTIKQCVSSGTATGNATWGSVTSACEIGGITSWNREGGKIIDCSSKTTVTALDGHKGRVGGIAGRNYGMITGCEASSSIESHAFAENSLGGIAGCNYSQILDSYYTGSSDIGIAGSNTGVIA